MHRPRIVQEEPEQGQQDDEPDECVPEMHARVVVVPQPPSVEESVAHKLQGPEDELEINSSSETPVCISLAKSHKNLLTENHHKGVLVHEHPKRHDYGWHPSILSEAGP
jgi:hypothetical protein